MDAGGVLKKIAPWFGAAAQAGATFVPFLQPFAAAIGKITGTNVTPDADSLTAAIAGASPEQRAEILKLHDQFQVQMQAMGFQHEESILEIAQKDRDSARQREIALKDWLPSTLAIVITLGFFGMLILVATHGVKPESRDLCNIMLGSLGAAWAAVVNYYFGSSAGSDHKTDLLAAAPPVSK